MKLAMNESTKVVAVAYANNTWYRKDVVYAREQILDVMPIGVPMTAKEICDKVKETGVANIWGGTLRVHPNSVYQCFIALEPYGVMNRIVEKLDTPYSFEVEYEQYDYDTRDYVIKKKTITKDSVIKYVRVV